MKIKLKLKSIVYRLVVKRKYWKRNFSKLVIFSHILNKG